jgi:hypothetical protein
MVPIPRRRASSEINTLPDVTLTLPESVVIIPAIDRRRKLA